MTFLAPWAGLIAASVAIPALIALYLLKLRRKPVRVSSTLLWERATLELQVNTPLRWLRRSLLLAIQLLALVCLLLAIARPAVPGAGVDAPRVIFVIDRSASMSARDGVDPSGRAAPPAGEEPPTRLDEAKRRAGEMVRAAARASGGGGVMVVALAGEALALTGLDSSPSDARAAIAGVTPTDQPAETDRLIELLAALRAGEGSEEGRAPPTSVVIFSDGDLTPREARSLPRDVSVRLERVGPASPGPVRNAGIVALDARRDHEDPEQLRVFVRAVNAGARPVETTIELRIDGELVDAKPLTIAGAGAGADAAGPPTPGEQSVTFETRRLGGGLAVVRLGGRDVLAADDAAGLRVPAASRPGVVLVHPVGAAPDPGVGGLLEDLDLAWLEVLNAAEFDRLSAGIEPTPGGRTLAQVDIVVLDRVSASRAPTTPTLSFASAPALEGVSFKPVDGAGDGAWRFTSWQRQHPLLRFASFDAVALAAPGELAFAPEARAHVLATGEPAGGGSGVQRPLIGVVEREGTRHVLVALSPSRSTWPADLSFPLFMQNAVDLLASRSDGVATGPLRTTDPVRVNAVPGASAIVVSGPVARSVPVGAGVRGGVGGASRAVELGVFELAGVYSLAGARSDQTPVAINLLDARESGAALVDSPRLPGMGPGVADGARPDGSGKGVLEVWPWFVLGAFVLAMVEWVVYARRMRG